MTDPTAQALPEGTHLAYTVYHEAHWWLGLLPHLRPDDGRRCVQVAASAKGAGGGVAWEFGVQEYASINALCVDMFGDAWPAFRQIPEFFDRLPDCDTLDAVRALLDELGAVDETERPAAKAAAA